MIALQNVSKYYHRNTGIKNVDLSFKNNYITGLIGKNGAGKTTLMKIICENIQKYDGEIEKNTNSKIGYLIENPKMYMNKTGRYNIKYFSEVLGVKNKEYINELVKVLGTESFLNKKVKHYSMGMKQRLGVLIAMLDKPDYLVLDEPTNGMDPDSSLEILNRIKELSIQENIGVLISSHKLEEIELICDEVIFLSNGVVTGQKYIEDLQSDKSTLLYFEVDEMKAAESILQAYDTKTDTVENYIEILNNVKIKDVLKLLSQNNLYPYSVKESSNTLKNYYFSMTKGEESS